MFERFVEAFCAKLQMRKLPAVQLPRRINVMRFWRGAIAPSSQESTNINPMAIRSSLVAKFISMVSAITLAIGPALPASAVELSKISDIPNPAPNTVHYDPQPSGGAPLGMIDQSSGQARFSQPLTSLSPSVGPNYAVGLTYDSSRVPSSVTNWNYTHPVGLAGLGFNVSGLNVSIVRNTKGTGFYWDDDFLLTGAGTQSKLLLVKENVDSNGNWTSREYTTTDPSFTKIVWVKGVYPTLKKEAVLPHQDASWQPSYWELTSEDGTIMRFGAYKARRSVFTLAGLSEADLYAGKADLTGYTGATAGALGTLCSEVKNAYVFASQGDAADSMACTYYGVEHSVRYGNWQGPKAVLSGAPEEKSQQYVESNWLLTEVQDVLGNATTLSYIQAAQKIGPSGQAKLFAKQSYLYQVASTSGEVIVLGYDPLAAGAEYRDPNQEDREPDGYQERFNAFQLSGLWKFKLALERETSAEQPPEGLVSRVKGILGLDNAVAAGKGSWQISVPMSGVQLNQRFLEKATKEGLHKNLTAAGSMSKRVLGELISWRSFDESLVIVDTKVTPETRNLDWPTMQQFSPGKQVKAAPATKFEYYNSEDGSIGATPSSYALFDKGMLLGALKTVTYPGGQAYDFTYRENKLDVHATLDIPKDAKLGDVALPTTNRAITWGTNYAVLTGQAMSSKTANKVVSKAALVEWTESGWKQQLVLEGEGAYVNNWGNLPGVNFPNLPPNNHPSPSALNLEAFAEKEQNLVSVQPNFFAYLAPMANSACAQLRIVARAARDDQDHLNSSGEWRNVFGKDSGPSYCSSPVSVKGVSTWWQPQSGRYDPPYFAGSIFDYGSANRYPQVFTSSDSVLVLFTDEDFGNSYVLFQSTDGWETTESFSGDFPGSINRPVTAQITDGYVAFYGLAGFVPAPLNNCGSSCTSSETVYSSFALKKHGEYVVEGPGSPRLALNISSQKISAQTFFNRSDRDPSQTEYAQAMTMAMRPAPAGAIGVILEQAETLYSGTDHVPNSEPNEIWAPTLLYPGGSRSQPAKSYSYIPFHFKGLDRDKLPVDSDLQALPVLSTVVTEKLGLGFSQPGTPYTPVSAASIAITQAGVLRNRAARAVWAYYYSSGELKFNEVYPYMCAFDTPSIDGTGSISWQSQSVSQDQNATSGLSYATCIAGYEQGQKDPDTNGIAMGAAQSFGGYDMMTSSGSNGQGQRHWLFATTGTGSDVKVEPTGPKLVLSSPGAAASVKVHYTPPSLSKAAETAEQVFEVTNLVIQGGFFLYAPVSTGLFTLIGEMPATIASGVDGKQGTYQISVNETHAGGRRYAINGSIMRYRLPDGNMTSVKDAATLIPDQDTMAIANQYSSRLVSNYPYALNIRPDKNSNFNKRAIMLADMRNGTVVSRVPGLVSTAKPFTLFETDYASDWQVSRAPLTATNPKDLSNCGLVDCSANYSDSFSIIYKSNAKSFRDAGDTFKLVFTGAKEKLVENTAAGPELRDFAVGQVGYDDGYQRYITILEQGSDAGSKQRSIFVGGKALYATSTVSPGGKTAPDGWSETNFYLGDEGPYHADRWWMLGAQLYSLAWDAQHAQRLSNRTYYKRQISPQKTASNKTLLPKRGIFTSLTSVQKDHGPTRASSWDYNEKFLISSVTSNHVRYDHHVDQQSKRPVIGDQDRILVQSQSRTTYGYEAYPELLDSNRLTAPFSVVTGQSERLGYVKPNWAVTKYVGSGLSAYRAYIAELPLTTADAPAATSVKAGVSTARTLKYPIWLQVTTTKPSTLSDTEIENNFVAVAGNSAETVYEEIPASSSPQTLYVVAAVKAAVPDSYLANFIGNDTIVVAKDVFVDQMNATPGKGQSGPFVKGATAHSYLKAQGPNGNVLIADRSWAYRPTTTPYSSFTPKPADLNPAKPTPWVAGTKALVRDPVTLKPAATQNVVGELAGTYLSYSEYPERFSYGGFVGATVQDNEVFYTGYEAYEDLSFDVPDSSSSCNPASGIGFIVSDATTGAGHGRLQSQDAIAEVSGAAKTGRRACGMTASTGKPGTVAINPNGKPSLPSSKNYILSAWVKSAGQCKLGGQSASSAIKSSVAVQGDDSEWLYLEVQVAGSELNASMSPKVPVLVCSANAAVDDLMLSPIDSDNSVSVFDAKVGAPTYLTPLASIDNKGHVSQVRYDRFNMPFTVLSYSTVAADASRFKSIIDGSGFVGQGCLVSASTISQLGNSRWNGFGRADQVGNTEAVAFQPAIPNSIAQFGARSTKAQYLMEQPKKRTGTNSGQSNIQIDQDAFVMQLELNEDTPIAMTMTDSASGEAFILRLVDRSASRGHLNEITWESGGSVRHVIAASAPMTDVPSKVTVVVAGASADVSSGASIFVYADGRLMLSHAPALRSAVSSSAWKIAFDTDPRQILVMGAPSIVASYLDGAARPIETHSLSGYGKATPSIEQMSPLQAISFAPNNRTTVALEEATDPVFHLTDVVTATYYDGWARPAVRTLPIEYTSESDQLASADATRAFPMAEKGALQKGTSLLQFRGIAGSKGSRRRQTGTVDWANASIVGNKHSLTMEVAAIGEKGGKATFRIYASDGSNKNYVYQEVDVAPLGDDPLDTVWIPVAFTVDSNPNGGGYPLGNPVFTPVSGMAQYYMFRNIKVDGRSLDLETGALTMSGGSKGTVCPVGNADKPIPSPCGAKIPYDPSILVKEGSGYHLLLDNGNVFMGIIDTFLQKADFFNQSNTGSELVDFYAPANPATKQLAGPGQQLYDNTAEDANFAVTSVVSKKSPLARTSDLTVMPGARFGAEGDGGVNRRINYQYQNDSFGVVSETKMGERWYPSIVTETTKQWFTPTTSMGTEHVSDITGQPIFSNHQWYAPDAKQEAKESMGVGSGSRWFGSQYDPLASVGGINGVSISESRQPNMYADPVTATTGYQSYTDTVAGYDLLGFWTSGKRSDTAEVHRFTDLLGRTRISVVDPANTGKTNGRWADTGFKAPSALQIASYRFLDNIGRLTETGRVVGTALSAQGWSDKATQVSDQRGTLAIQSCPVTKTEYDVLDTQDRAMLMKYHVPQLGYGNERNARGRVAEAKRYNFALSNRAISQCYSGSNDQFNYVSDMYFYDDLGRTSAKYTLHREDAATPPKVFGINYMYESSGNMVVTQYPSDDKAATGGGTGGLTVYNHLDRLGRPYQVSSSSKPSPTGSYWTAGDYQLGVLRSEFRGVKAGTMSSALEKNYVYDFQGRVKKISEQNLTTGQSPNVLTEEFAYIDDVHEISPKCSAFGRAYSVSDIVYLKRSGEASFDENGNPATVEQCYRYDGRGYLTHVASLDGTGKVTKMEQFQYDANGNMTSRCVTPAGGTPKCDKFAMAPGTNQIQAVTFGVQ